MKIPKVEVAALKKMVRGGLLEFFERHRIRTPSEAAQNELAKGARLKAMLDSGGFQDFTETFIDQWLGNLLQIADDVEYNRANPDLLAARIYGAVRELKTFTILQNELRRYESAKEKVEEKKNLEHIQRAQAEFAR